MDIKIMPGPLSGHIRAIPSKSHVHRLLICAALSEGPCRIGCHRLSADIEATASCLRALGADIEYSDGAFFLRPIEKVKEMPLLDCGESGSTLRFLLPVAAALGRGARIKMRGRLSERPLLPLLEELKRHGISYSYENGDSIVIEGKLRPGDYRIMADISSQFISGLLLALPLLDGESRVFPEGKMESRGYVSMTLECMENFGLPIVSQDGSFLVSPGLSYRSPGSIDAGGDWSNAAFFLAADRLSGGGKIEVSGLDNGSLQPDRAVNKLMDKVALGNAEIDISDVPDLMPLLSVIAALSPGKTDFINARRLRFKESDRISSTCRMLECLGAKCEEGEESLTVYGGMLRGGTVKGAGDHRIVMAAALAAIACREPVTILGAEAADKSYPGFFDDYRMLGGKIL